jgi:hypothetical protein
MKHKKQHLPAMPRTIDSLKTIGYLMPTTQQNQRRPIPPDEKFTYICMLIAAIASALLVAFGA